MYNYIMDKKYLEDRLRELGIYSEYYHRLELKLLAQVVPYDEQINCILTGVYEGSRRLCAVTQSRILIISSGVLDQKGGIVIPRNKVTSWNFDKKFLLSSASFTADGKKYEFKQTQAGRKDLFEWAMNQPVKEYD